MSKKTFPQEEKLCSYELEVHSVVTDLMKFKIYLDRTKFKILTVKLFWKLSIRTILHRKLRDGQDFNYDIILLPAFHMQHVDRLSCYPVFFLIRHINFQREYNMHKFTNEFLSGIKQQ